MQVIMMIITGMHDMRIVMSSMVLKTKNDDDDDDGDDDDG